MKTGSYIRLWRWHFYAALFITPLLITLTLSGIGYLFYTDVENKAYASLFFGEGGETRQLTIDEGIEKTLRQYKGYSISKVIVLDEPYNTRLTLKNNEGNQQYVFLDNHYETIGSQDAKYTFSNVMREIHSSLFVGGTVVNYLVELAACWAIFLMFSGIYMTFKGRALKKKPNPTKRQRNRKWHAFMGTIVTIPMILIIFTGLPWSAFMGDILYSAAQKYPSFGFPAITQRPPTSDMSEIPWATRKNDAPSSNASAPHHGSMPGTSLNDGMISIQQLMNEVEKAQISKPYSIIYPTREDDVFIISKGSNTGVTGLDVSPYDEMTAYFDQYSGKLISKVGYADYGLLAKWFTWGIPLHEGHLFGWPNKLINLAVCLSFLLVILWGITTWLSRIKEGKISAQPAASNSFSFGLTVFMVILGLVMPLFGISLMLVVIIEWILYINTKTGKSKKATV
nr:PepSY domain-containing protein [Paenibacillus hamazuiensis]